MFRGRTLTTTLTADPEPAPPLLRVDAPPPECALLLGDGGALPCALRLDVAPRPPAVYADMSLEFSRDILPSPMPLPYLAPGPGECAPDGPRPCRSTGGAPYFAGDPTGVPPPVELPLLWRGRPPVPRGCREDGGAIPDIVSLVTRTIPKSQSRVSRVYTLVARVNGSQRGLTSQPRLFGSLGRDGFRYFDTTKRAKESVQHSRFGIFFATQSPVRSAVRYFVEIAFSPVLSHVFDTTCHVLRLISAFCQILFARGAGTRDLLRAKRRRVTRPTHDMLGDYLTALLVAVLGYIYPVYLCFKVSR